MAVENQTLAQFLGNDRQPYNYAKVEQVGRDLTTSWLTLDEITQQINLFDDESQDGYLQSLELAVRMAIEDFIGKSIFPIQYRVYYPNYGVYNTALFLDLPQVTYSTQFGAGIAVNRVEYYASNTPTVLAASNYFYDPTGNRVVINQLPQTLAQNIDNPVVVTYTANANFVAQFPVVKQAGLLLFTHLYNNRSNTTEGVLHDIPFGVAQLLRPYKDLVM
jgi:hypothetical protein